MHCKFRFDGEEVRVTVYFRNHFAGGLVMDHADFKLMQESMPHVAFEEIK